MRGINKVALGISLAALSLTAGNAMAQAEETPADTPIAVLRTAHDTVNNIAHHDGSTHPIITIEHHDTDHKDSTKHAPLPPREILDSSPNHSTLLAATSSQAPPNTQAPTIQVQTVTTPQVLAKTNTAPSLVAP